MAKKQKIQLFEEKKVRTVWDDDKEKWFFCVVDVVEKGYYLNEKVLRYAKVVVAI